MAHRSPRCGMCAKGNDRGNQTSPSRKARVFMSSIAATTGVIAAANAATAAPAPPYGRQSRFHLRYAPRWRLSRTFPEREVCVLGYGRDRPLRHPDARGHLAAAPRLGVSAARARESGGYRAVESARGVGEAQIRSGRSSHNPGFAADDLLRTWFSISRLTVSIWWPPGAMAATSRCDFALALSRTRSAQPGRSYRL